MVLEAFLLIHLSGSSILCNTESIHSCLFERIVHGNQVEDFIDLTKDTKGIVNERIFSFGKRYTEPDTIIKNIDSNSLDKNSIIIDIESKSLSHDISPIKDNIFYNTSSKIEFKENSFDLPKPEFALAFEQNSNKNFAAGIYKYAEIGKSHSKSDILHLGESFDFPNRILPQIKLSAQHDWFSIILLSAILLIAWIRSFFGRYFQQSLQSLYDFTLSTRLFRNRNVLLPRISFFLLVNFILISSLYIFKAFEISKISIFKASLANFILLNVILLLLISFRYISFHGLNLLFPRNQLILEYHYQVQNFYKSIGLIILPLLIFETYFPIENAKLFIWSGICLVVLLYAYRLLRGQRIIKRRNFPFYYLLLYLATFEILPFSIFFKIFSRFI